MLLFHDDLQVNILPYYRYAAVLRWPASYLTIVMLLFQDDLQVNILPYYRYAALSC